MSKSRSRLRLALTVVATVALAMSIIVTLSGFQDQPNPPTLCEALALIGTTPFVEMALGAFVAILLEYWPAWDGLAPKFKRPVVFGFCLVVPVISLGGTVLLCGAAFDQDTIYAALAAGALAFMGSQFAHIYKLPSA